MLWKYQALVKRARKGPGIDLKGENSADNRTYKARSKTAANAAYRTKTRCMMEVLIVGQVGEMRPREEAMRSQRVKINKSILTLAVISAFQLFLYVISGPILVSNEETAPSTPLKMNRSLIRSHEACPKPQGLPNTISNPCALQLVTVFDRRHPYAVCCCLSRTPRGRFPTPIGFGSRPQRFVLS